jgi:hypothetical protein
LTVQLRLLKSAANFTVNRGPHFCGQKSRAELAREILFDLHISGIDALAETMILDIVMTHAGLAVMRKQLQKRARNLRLLAAPRREAQIDIAILGAIALDHLIVPSNSGKIVPHANHAAAHPRLRTVHCKKGAILQQRPHL